MMHIVIHETNKEPRSPTNVNSPMGILNSANSGRPADTCAQRLSLAVDVNGNSSHMRQQGQFKPMRWVTATDVAKPEFGPPAGRPTIG
jgi:hypothetical protein